MIDIGQIKKEAQSNIDELIEEKLRLQDRIDDERESLSTQICMLAVEKAKALPSYGKTMLYILRQLSTVMHYTNDIDSHYDNLMLSNNDAVGRNEVNKALNELVESDIVVKMRKYYNPETFDIEDEENAPKNAKDEDFFYEYKLNTK